MIFSFINLGDRLARSLLALLILLPLSPPVFAQTTGYMLDNGVLRFGGLGSGSTTYSTVDSIVNSGMLQQPHYFSGADQVWYKLTYSDDLPLSLTIGTGTGSNWTGSTVATGGHFDTGRLGLVTLADLEIDATGFTTTRTVGSVEAGYGSLTVTGSAVVNSQTMGIQHRYELGQADGFVQITTTLTNPSATETISNAHMWVGTRDDWVGTSDRPNKRRGNIVDDVFQTIEQVTDPSSALLIQSGDEAAFFYTTTPNVNTAYAGCCDFRNAYDATPSSVPPESGSADGSYAIYLPVGDLAPGASQELIWFYAAGALADIDDVIAGVAQAASSVTNVQTNSADLEVESSEDGTGYWLVAPGGSAPPTAEQLADPGTYGPAVISGNQALTANAPAALTLSPLVQGTAYTVFFMVDTGTSGSPVYSDVSGTDFTTILPAPSSVSAAAGFQSASVSWGSVANATSYEVTSAPGGLTCSATAPETSCTLAGLINGTTYTFTVVASNTVATSAPSVASAGTTPAPGPVDATISTITANPATGVTADGAAAATLTLTVLDVNTNPVSGESVFFSITGGAGGSLTAGPWTTNASGLATATLSSTAASTITVMGYLGTSSLGTSIGTVTVDFVAGAPTQLAITTQPVGGASGETLLQQPVIEVRDAQGNLVTGASDAVTVAIQSGSGGTLGGTQTVNAVNGVATFSNLTLAGTVGEDYLLRFSSGLLTPVDSSAVTVTAGAVTQVAITAQPSASARNDQLFPAQPIIQLQDAQGNSVASSGVEVLVGFANDPLLKTGVLGGTLTVTTNASGQAGFSDLKITGETGPRELLFTSAGLASATSNTINLVAGDAHALLIVRQPSSQAQNDLAFTEQPQIRIVDVSNNPVASGGVTITAALASGDGSANFKGTLTAATDADGLAEFAGLSIEGPTGDYTLSFTASPLQGVTSQTVTVSAGPPQTLFIAVQPPALARNDELFGPQPVIQLRDSAGNDAPVAGVAVTVAIASGTSELRGTLTVSTNTNGQAVFSDLLIFGKVGTRTLSFSADDYASVTSSAIELECGQCASLAILTQPVDTPDGQPFPVDPVVEQRDSAGNRTFTPRLITVAIGSGNGTLAGTTTLQSVDGQVVFDDLSITGTPGPYTLTFTSEGLSGASSDAFQVLSLPRIGGEVSGLAANGLVLQLNGTDDLPIDANGTFQFTQRIEQGSSYLVTVRQQPTRQTCTVSNGSGTNVTADVTNVAVSCVADSFSIGGSLVGLVPGEAVILQNNGGDDLTLSANGTFAFATEIDSGTDYAVTVLTQPAGQTCSVSNGSGTNVTADVTNVDLACTDLPDTDGDGTPDEDDAFPLDPVEDTDTDNDSIGDNGDAGSAGIGVRILDAPVACSFDGSVTASAVKASNAPGTPFDTQLEYALTSCGSSVAVQAVFGEALPDGAVAYKVSGDGDWTEIPGATIAGDTVTYTIEDNGPLDADPAAGRILDPVTVVTPTPRAPATPVPVLPVWMLALLVLITGGFGMISLRRSASAAPFFLSSATSTRIPTTDPQSMGLRHRKSIKI